MKALGSVHGLLIGSALLDYELERATHKHDTCSHHTLLVYENAANFVVMHKGVSEATSRFLRAQSVNVRILTGRVTRRTLRTTYFLSLHRGTFITYTVYELRVSCMTKLTRQDVNAFGCISKCVATMRHGLR